MKKRKDLLINIPVAITSIALFIAINLYSSFGIAASFKNPISKPDSYGMRHVGFLFLIPLLIELVSLWVIISKNYSILTKKYYDIDFSGEITLFVTIFVYGIFVYFFHWGVA
jgi:uncharacterized membrane protein YhaH (DUF805 family)